MKASTSAETPRLHQSTFTERMAVSKTRADNLTDTVSKCDVKDCRLINTVEDKGFTEVQNAAPHLFYKIF